MNMVEVLISQISSFLTNRKHYVSVILHGDMSKQETSFDIMNNDVGVQGSILGPILFI